MAESAKNNAFTSVLGGQKQRRRRSVKQNAAEEGRGSEKMRYIGGQFDEAVARKLKEISGREGTTILNLLAEALNMLFEDRGEPPIARGGKR
jgi:hypothetical protein